MKRKKLKQKSKINILKEEILKGIKRNINSDLAKEINQIFPIKTQLISNFEYRQKIWEKKLINSNNFKF